MDLFGLYKSDEELIDERVRSIKGLAYYPNFINKKEEFKLIKAIDSEKWINDLTRKVQHYGFKYDYRARRLDESFQIGALPVWSQFLIDRMVEKGLITFYPDQLIINNYEIGEGISMHVDCEPCFTDTILSLSLFSDIVMDFASRNSRKNQESILLKRGSLLMISGDARYKYAHGIAKRKGDTFNRIKRRRDRRISLTFRKVILNN